MKLNLKKFPSAILMMAMICTFSFGTLTTAKADVVTGGKLWGGLNDNPNNQISRDNDGNDLFFNMNATTMTINSIGPVTGSWQAFPVPSETGDTFFDNPSQDGPQDAFPYLITGTGGQATNPASPHIPYTQLQYFGTASGGAVNTFFTATGPVTWTVDATITNQVNFNVAFWYTMQDPNSLLALCTLAGCSTTFDPGDGVAYGIAYGDGLANLGKTSVGPAFNDVFAQQIGGVNTPEPSSAALIALASMLLFFGRKMSWFRRKSDKNA